MTDGASDIELLKWMSTLGVGGILACFMFFFYRKDIRQYTEMWKEQSVANNEIIKDNTLSQRENAVSNARLITLLDALHRRLDRSEREHGAP